MSTTNAASTRTIITSSAPLASPSLASGSFRHCGNNPRTADHSRAASPRTPLLGVIPILTPPDSVGVGRVTLSPGTHSGHVLVSASGVPSGIRLPLWFQVRRLPESNRRTRLCRAVFRVVLGSTKRFATTVVALSSAVFREFATLLATLFPPGRMPRPVLPHPVDGADGGDTAVWSSSACGPCSSVRRRGRAS